MDGDRGDDTAGGSTDGWIAVLAADEVAPGSLRAVEAFGDEWVLWRTRAGVAAVMPRRCPHLDHDLAEATVVGDWLVCPGHEWCFDPAGHAGKVNVRGRFDRKDDVALPRLREHSGRVELSPPSPAGIRGADGRDRADTAGRGDRGDR